MILGISKVSSSHFISPLSYPTPLQDNSIYKRFLLFFVIVLVIHYIFPAFSPPVLKDYSQFSSRLRGFFSLFRSSFFSQTTYSPLSPLNIFYITLINSFFARSKLFELELLYFPIYLYCYKFGKYFIAS